MGGPFMVEIVFCRVTRRGRKKKAGMNKLARENCRNDGPMGGGFVPPDTLKITLDLSDTGPVFSALDDMMMKMMEDDERARIGGRTQDNSAAKVALKKLLKSGIPGIEAMFGAEDPTPKFGKKGSSKKGFHKMTDASKKKFMNAIFGEEGTQIDSSTAAALLAATCSGGNADIGNKLAELLMPELDEKVDPAMMAALMAACSVIQTGANTEEVLNIMKLELAASGLSEEEILEKAKLLMRAFGKEEAGSTAEFMLMSKQTNAALVKSGLPPKDFTLIVLAHKALAACGTSSENVAKILMVFSVLGKKGANPAHVASSMKNLGAMSDEAKADCKEKILKSWGNNKFGKSDVQGTVRMHQALDNENEPGWAEVKNLKDIVGGVSPTSPEAIELNLARAIKAGGLKKDDIGRALMALKAVTVLGIDLVKLSKIIFLEKTICESGVPASEVARVLNDGLMPPEAISALVSSVAPKLNEDGCKPADVDGSVTLYNNLKFKSNIPTEIIEFVDKTLIQVRCSLEDVADNMISSLCARGEKTARIIGQVTETLKNTGATAHVVATTLMPPLVEMTGESEASLIRTIARNLKEVDYEAEDVKSAITELVLKIIDNDMSQYVDSVKALEDSLKDMGMFANEVQEYIKANIPSPPTPPEEIERRAQMAAELARLEAEEAERERLKALKEADPGAYDREMRAKLADLKESDPAAYEAEMKKMGKSELDRLLSKADSRRGSLLPGQTRSRAGSIVIGTGSRRGSCSGTGTNRATVAMVTDDPEHKSAMKEQLANAFGGEECDTNGYDDDEEETNQKNLAGSLPAGTKIEAGADGQVTLGGTKLPQGAAVVTNADGSKSIQVTAEQEELVAKMLASGMDEATAYQYLQQLCGAGVAGKGKTLCNAGGAVSFRTAEESVENAKELLNAFDRAIQKHKNRPKIEVPKLTPEAKALMEQILASNGSKEEIASRVEALLAGSELSSSRGVNGGIDGNKKEKIPVSGPVRKAYIMLDESYEAMQPGSGPRRQGSWREKEVARRKNHNLGLAHHLGRRRQSWMSEAEELLRLQYRASLDRIMKMSIYDNKSSYDIQFMVNEFMFNSANLSEARGRRGGLPMDPMARPGQQGGSLADRIRARNAAKEGAEDGTGRGSVKRQSDIQREKKKSRQEEREEEKARKASYYRRVTGLRKAKVPMMVYSCGGFSRCFRVCRFYDVEGPPVGVEYEAPTPVTTRNL